MEDPKELFNKGEDMDNLPWRRIIDKESGDVTIKDNNGNKVFHENILFETEAKIIVNSVNNFHPLLDICKKVWDVIKVMDEEFVDDPEEILNNLLDCLEPLKKAINDAK